MTGSSGAKGLRRRERHTLRELGPMAGRVQSGDMQTETLCGSWQRLSRLSVSSLVFHRKRYNINFGWLVCTTVERGRLGAWTHHVATADAGCCVA